MKLVFLGPPGAGKGTQAERICKEFGIVHISTGEMFRMEIAEKTPLGNLAASYINKGELVPDECVIGMVKSRIEKCANGFLLDGFPRTLSQAEALTESVSLDAVVDIEVPKERLIDRILCRRSCHDCDAVYDIRDLGGNEFCPVCGKKLSVRDDDTAEILAERYHVYEEKTKPIIEFYKALALLIPIDGDNRRDVVSEEIMRKLKEAGL